MAAKIDGSLWLAPYEKELWPVVLCNDDIPPKIFMDSRKSSYDCPAILLGKRIYVWVAYNQLQELKPDEDYIDGKQFENNDIQASDTPQEQLQKLRRVAFTVDAKDPQTPDYYKNHIIQRSATRKLEAVMLAKANKRRRSRDDDDDDDIQIIGSRRRSSGDSRSPKDGSLPTPKSSIRKRKRSDDSREDRDGSGDDLFVRGTNELDDPFKMTEEEQRMSNWASVQKNPPTDDMCTIFVGPEQTPFLVPTKSVGECDFLSDLVCFTEATSSHINLAHDTDVNAKEFVEVWDYMGKGDFVPRLIDSKTRGVCLERVVLPEEKDVAATKIAKVYVTAAKIRHTTLQQLCLHKLQKIYPLSSHSLLTVLMIFMKADACLTAKGVDQEGREWLIDHVVEQYWTLSRNESTTFTRLMSAHCELTHAILLKFGQNPKMAHGID